MVSPRVESFKKCEITGLSCMIDLGSAKSSCNDEGVQDLTVGHSRQKED